MSIYRDILDRIMESIKKSKDTELAEFLGVTSQDIYNWRTRKKFDLDEVLDICKRKNLDIKYILTGDLDSLSEAKHADLITCKAKLEVTEKKYNDMLKLLSETIATGKMAHKAFTERPPDTQAEPNAKQNKAG